MKKTILAFGIAIVLLATAVFGAVEPNITLYDNLSWVTMPSCVSAEGDIYCFGNYSATLDDGMYKYDIDLKTYTQVGTLETGVQYGDHWECFYYSDFIYCIGQNLDTVTQSNFKIKPDGSGYANISDVLGYGYGCDLRPTTDEIWCYGSYSGNVLYQNNNIFKYDISLDTVTVVANMPYNASTWVRDSSCAFRNNNDFYCVGGKNSVLGGSQNIQKLKIYDITLNSSVEKDFASPMALHHCRWHLDILYCYEGETPNGWYPVDFISYYDPSNDTTGNLTTTLPYELWGRTNCMEFDDYVDYCFGGYITQNWFDSNAVLKIVFSIPITPPAPTWSPDYTADDLAPALFEGIGRMLITFVAFAGIITMVLLFSWGMKKIKFKK